ncbi:MAG: PQQ-like beta-propeller repeat protein [Bryobacterales bacterium]|nr:PQQ-like beta-propeller repeat protein [Bryobacterales bacterium]
MLARTLTFTALALSLQAGDWTQWRGPLNGIAESDAPTSWTDKNVVWKAAIPGRGFSTPVIHGDRIFLTSAVPANEAAASPSPGGGGPGGGAGVGEHKFVVLALDRKTGKTIWERTALTGTPHEGYHRRYGSYASNSPVTDGKMVWAYFGSRGLFAYDRDGNLKWKKDMPAFKMRLQFGEGSAPVLEDNLLILACDSENDSFLLAVDKNTGKEVYRVKREEVSSWSHPLIFTHQGVKQIIVAASAKVRSYEFATGKLIWECAGLGVNVIPTPVVQGDVVYVMSGYRNPNLLAIKLGGKGDITGTSHVLWTNQRGNSYTASPVLQDNKLYFITDSGMLSCFNATTGEPYYSQQRLGKPYNFKASPVAANGKLYLATEEGDVVVVKMGEKLEVLAVNTMADQSFISSPVIVDGTLYLRGQNTLFAIR